MMRPFAVLALLLGACAGHAQQYVEAKGRAYPLHFERNAPRAHLTGLDTPWAGTDCEDSPEHAAFLARGIAQLDPEELEALADEFCPEADSVAFVAPFVASSGGHEGDFVPKGDYLALRFECVFDRDSETFEELRGPDRTSRARAARDAWLKQVGASVRLIWNIALFQVSEAGTHFRDLVWNNERLLDLWTQIQIYPYPPTADSGWWACGAAPNDPYPPFGR